MSVLRYQRLPVLARQTPFAARLSAAPACTQVDREITAKKYPAFCGDTYLVSLLFSLSSFQLVFHAFPFIMHAANLLSACCSSYLIFSIPAFTDAILILVLPMAENRVLSQFPAVNESLHEPHQKRDQQKAKRSRRKQQQTSFVAKPRQRQGRVLFPKILSYQSLRFSFHLIIHIASYCAKNAFFMFLSYHVFVILQASFANFTQNTRSDLTETAKYNLTAPFHTNSIHKQRRLTA